MDSDEVSDYEMFLFRNYQIQVRKRKEYAERKVKERHAALRKEAEERRKHTVEHRERCFFY